MGKKKKVSVQPLDKKSSKKDDDRSAEEKAQDKHDKKVEGDRSARTKGVVPACGLCHPSCAGEKPRYQCRTIRM
jgi:hypothetical protein